MSKKRESENSDVIVDVQEVYSKTEQFIEDNKNNLSIIIGGIVVVVALYFGYKKLYLAPMETEAQSQLFMAEKYFEKDSLDKAINGDGLNYGFIDIADEYGSTKSGNLAHYYLGLCYFKTGDYEASIDEMKSFSSNDVMLSSISIGVIGDAHMELGEVDAAIDYYEKAAKKNENNVTTPFYLYKAGLAYEENGNYESAVEKYAAIKSSYPESTEGRNIEKYISRAKAMQ